MKVIKHSNLPAKLPLYSTLVAALALDYWHAPQWLWGAIGILFLILWILSIVAMVKQEETDIFKDK